MIINQIAAGGGETKSGTVQATAANTKALVIPDLIGKRNAAVILSSNKSMVNKIVSIVMLDNTVVRAFIDEGNNDSLKDVLSYATYAPETGTFTLSPYEFATSTDYYYAAW